jgi:hypothetical protein
MSKEIMSKGSSAHRTLSRRQMLRLTSMSMAGLALAACAAPTSSPGTTAGSAPAADQSASVTVFNSGGDSCLC